MFTAQYHRTVQLATTVTLSVVGWMGFLHMDWRVACGGHKHLLTGVQRAYWDWLDDTMGVPPYTPAERRLITIEDVDRVPLGEWYIRCGSEKEAAKMAFRHLTAREEGKENTTQWPPQPGP
mmetsp:Transcript_28153/g.89990  ORF Transcript_28153/g.89990 Transcript_28153/m.89990 type:complete len:121 (-) Transcript_28153:269-631(-)|eukprot:CAMPEP_0118885468 /NCGR_PEP_ID=MMETSP1163-20130328/23932_1 /TAXON_ID=124430 /ORGANISM="Phaeomonas parva, Strain CCMP2877" /LENGTH=120 /DNA_ID=CAMNT_0006823491 /DNA_START=404 /DNA_END=766 /DNA_ORIENTATION=+